MKKYLKKHSNRRNQRSHYLKVKVEVKRYQQRLLNQRIQHLREKKDKEKK